MFRTVRQPLFNTEGSGGGEGGEQPVTSSSEGFNPTWGLPSTNQAAAHNPLLNPEQTPAPTPAPNQPAPTGQVFDFAGRKIEVSDPSIAAALKDVHKDYTALSGTFTQTSQRMKDLEQANQTYMNILQQMQQQPGGGQNAAQLSQQQNQPQQQSAEELEQMKSDFQERFYEDPRSAIEGLMESLFQQKIQPIIEPISQERQWNEQIQALQQKYPEDFPQLLGQMQELISEMPQLVDHGLEAVLQLAKRTQPAPQPQPEQLLNNPEFLQRMMQNPEIQQQFLSQYVQGKQATQAPTLIGGQPGGQAPMVPEDRPKDIRTATQAFKRHLGLF